eukprot:TRINITY_DN11207_c0_g1_i1.p1 TRINITY_DN11207_c0_g1~~TRINITY_DN11207_c0_g1_i1.p1  ORF type:complete len:740 (-),score=168.33 TRINITY_DN11207_c0_g1_i1:95-2278(-)
MSKRKSPEVETTFTLDDNDTYGVIEQKIIDFIKEKSKKRSSNRYYYGSGEKISNEEWEDLLYGVYKKDIRSIERVMNMWGITGQPSSIMYRQEGLLYIFSLLGSDRLLSFTLSHFEDYKTGIRYGGSEVSAIAGNYSSCMSILLDANTGKKKSNSLKNLLLIARFYRRKEICDLLESHIHEITKDVDRPPAINNLSELSAKKLADDIVWKMDHQKRQEYIENVLSKQNQDSIEALVKHIDVSFFDVLHQIFHHSERLQKAVTIEKYMESYILLERVYSIIWSNNHFLLKFPGMESQILLSPFKNKELFSYKSSEECNFPSLLNHKELIGVGPKSDIQFGSPSIVDDVATFNKHFDAFTNNIFKGFDWKDGTNFTICAGGGTIPACMTPLSNKEIEKDDEKLKQFYLEKYPSSDIDLFIIASKVTHWVAAVERILKHLKDKVGEVIFLHTQETITIITGYPNRNIQIPKKYFPQMNKLLIYADLDCTAMGFDGETVYATPRSMVSLNYLWNIATNRSKNIRLKVYEDRLAKYSQRGYKVVLPCSPLVFQESQSKYLEKVAIKESKESLKKEEEVKNNEEQMIVNDNNQNDDGQEDNEEIGDEDDDDAGDDLSYGVRNRKFLLIKYEHQFSKDGTLKLPEKKDSIPWEEGYDIPKLRELVSKIEYIAPDNYGQEEEGYQYEENLSDGISFIDHYDIQEGDRYIQSSYYNELFSFPNDDSNSRQSYYDYY